MNMTTNKERTYPQAIFRCIAQQPDTHSEAELPAGNLPISLVLRI